MENIIVGGDYMIPENMRNLLEEFEKISKMGWIRNTEKGKGSVGLNFERCLNKKPDSLFFPDYEGVEIKCTTRFSRFPISLFSVAFEGPTFPEINRIVDLYGYPDYEYPDKNVLKVDVKCGIKKKCGNFKFSLFYEDSNKRIYLDVYDLNDHLIERKSYISLDTFLSHIRLKLNYFALIKASKKEVDEDVFYRYYHFYGYKLKSDEIIIDLLQKGIVFATLESRVGKSSYNAGKYKNKNLVFKIKKEDLNKLFEEMCEVDEDYGINKLIEKNNQKNFYIMN